MSTGPSVSDRSWSASALRDSYSQYRLSTSNPFGFLLSYRTGTSTISPSCFLTFVGVSSTTLLTILGYFLDSHLNKAGTPYVSSVPALPTGRSPVRTIFTDIRSFFPQLVPGDEVSGYPTDEE